MLGDFFAFYSVDIVFVLFFAICFVTVLVRGISSFVRWRKNSRSPRLTVTATMISRRTERAAMRRHGCGYGGGIDRYFATFQVESGDRMEFQLEGHEYGMLLEGDKGRLTFQGTRYLGFDIASR